MDKVDASATAHPTRPDLTRYLGRHLNVTVDRPLGSRHPLHTDIFYPLNYGYVEGTISGDGEPVDAYVVGVFEPLKQFEGLVIAVVLRADDDEDKLVVAPEGVRYSVEQFEAMLEFQERFFTSNIVALDTQPAGADVP